MEHILVSDIMNHFDSHQILSNLQHGFRGGHSCETQLIAFVEDPAKEMRNGSQTDVVVIDVSNAFDKVPQQELLYKSILKEYAYKQPTAHTKGYYKYSFYSRAISEWNELPRKIVLSCSMVALQNATCTIYRHFIIRLIFLFLLLLYLIYCFY